MSGSRACPVLGKAMTSRTLSLFGELGHEAIYPHRKARMGRDPVAGMPRREAEPRLDHFFGQAEYAEDLGLELRPIDSHASGSHLPVVEHEVVGKGPNREGILVDQRDVLGVRRGERMVSRLWVTVFVEVLEQWKVHHPYEHVPTELVRRPPQVRSKPAEDAPHDLLLSRRRLARGSPPWLRSVRASVEVPRLRTAPWTRSKLAVAPLPDPHQAGAASSLGLVDNAFTALRDMSSVSGTQIAFTLAA